MSAPPIDPRVDIGHVHLRVADINRSLPFWHDVLGFEEQARMGDQAAFQLEGASDHGVSQAIYLRDPDR